MKIAAAVAKSPAAKLSKYKSIEIITAEQRAVICLLWEPQSTEDNVIVQHSFSNAAAPRASYTGHCVQAECAR